MAAVDPIFRIECQLGETAFIVGNLNSIGNPDVIGGGTWSDLMADVVGGFRCHYGIDGNSPNDRTASAGSLTFTLRNDERNSVLTEGAYSPFSPVKRAGFNYNIPVRLVIIYGGITTYKFFGSLADVVPRINDFNTTDCTALDIFDDFARIEEPELPIQLNKRGDEILNAMFDAMTTQPVRRQFEVGQETWAIALDGGTGQKMKVRERINQIDLSEFGYCYPIGDQIGGGTVVWESRRHRAANPTVHFWLLNSDILRDGSFSVNGSRNDFYRNVEVAVYPTNDVSVTPISVLFDLQTTQTVILPGETNTSIFGPYRDNTNTQVGGTETVDPQPFVDYVMNTSADGTGTDITLNFIVTSSRTAAGVRWTITNNGSVAGFIRKLQQRGKAVKRTEILIDSVVAGSYGDQLLEIAMPFQNNVNVGKDVADYLAKTFSQSYANLPPVRFLASRDSTHLLVAFGLEPGDRIAITEDVIGLDQREYTINSVTLEVTDEHLVYCTWGLEPASSQRYWLMGSVGSSEIGLTTVFGF